MKPRVREVIVVEGRYDKNALSQVVDAAIVEVGGFAVFNDREKTAYLRALAEKRGLILLTDPDGAGFVIRGHLKGVLPPDRLKQAYIPDIPGKEKRKRAPGKEGLLGVEGMTKEILLEALENAGADLGGEAAKKPGASAPDRLACGCAGTQVRTLAQEEAGQDAPAQPGRLQNWPVQLQLVPERAPYFDGCDLLIAADCTAYACGSFHADFIRGRVTLIGCPKLDRADYAEKLTAILTENDVRSVTLTRMEVPCCGGLEYAARQAVAASGKDIPMRVVTFTAEGKILPQDA